MATPANDVVDSFMDYVGTFQTLDPVATLPHLHVPCLFIGPGGVRMMERPAEVQAFLTQLMRDLRSRDYERSDISRLSVHPMNETTAMVSVSRTRYTTAGLEMERFGETYTMRKAEGHWKVVVAVVHDADVALSSRRSVIAAETDSAASRGVRTPS